MSRPNADSFRRAIRYDKLRRLYEEAVSQGWVGRLDGRGHVRMEGPDGRHFWISTTAAGGGFGHFYENTKASARRAGLDVRRLP